MAISHVFCSVRSPRRFRRAPVPDLGTPSVDRGSQRLLRAVRRQGARGHLQLRLPGRHVHHVAEHRLGRAHAVAVAVVHRGRRPPRQVLLVHVFVVGHRRRRRRCHRHRGHRGTPATAVLVDAAAVRRPPTTPPPLFRPVAERFVRRFRLNGHVRAEQLYNTKSRTTV